MDNWITQFMEEFGYIGIFLIMALETLFPPIPSEIVLPFSGFMTTVSELSLVGVLIAATSGAVLGGICFYRLGLLLDVERLEKIIDRWGHLLKIKKEELHRADAWFDRYGIWTVFFCRMVPVLRSLISIPAGMSNMNFKVFLLFTTAGTLIWNTLLAGLGAGFGEAWPLISEYIDVYSKIVYLLLLLLMILAVIWYVRFRRRGSNKFK
jgi:membrane protein DedA with SNARE-associated domain